VLDNTRGFTITELIVAVVAGSIVALAVLSITLFFYADIMRSNAETQLTMESQSILRTVVEDLRTGSSVVVSNDNPPAGVWTTSNANLILIVSSPAQDTNYDFIIDSATGEPYQDETIYFAEDSVLYKRVLIDPGAINNKASTSTCQSTSSTSCPEDIVLSEAFSSMTFTFYDQDDAVTTDPTVARSVDMTIDLETDSFGRVLMIDNGIRMTLKNTL
jgi:prepilin-type N-terminal cleavage/methylation domain-containing protein